MKKILAVSGGIDSVVMLHLLRHEKGAIVAHFDHGIRPNSAEDCHFVERLAKEYHLPFVSKQGKLGADCSEASARDARYAFFDSLRTDPEDCIYVANHADDVLESITINLLRGTGWRGLAPMRNSAITRPLIKWTKSDIYRYATEQKLHFRLDQTNSDDGYLRNRVRTALSALPQSTKTQIIKLYERQVSIADEVDEIIANIITPDERQPRAIFEKLDDDIALELLRAMLEQNDIYQTRPQLTRALAAIRSYAPGKQFPLGAHHHLRVYKYNFQIC